MTKLGPIVFACCLLTLSAASGQLLDGPGIGGDGLLGGRERLLTARLIPEYTQVRPGQRFHVAVEMIPGEGWAYYSAVPGKSGDFEPPPARIETAAGELFDASPTLWPEGEPYKYELPGKPGEEPTTYVNRAFKGRAVAYVPLTVAEDAPAGDHTIIVVLDGQVCGHGQCVTLRGPEAVEKTLNLRIGPRAIPNPGWAEEEGVASGLESARTAEEIAAARQADAPTVAAAERPLFEALALAVLAGLMLNIMPCVLPIIPLRIYSVIDMGQGSRRRFVTLGLAFAAGVFLFFAALGALNLVLHVARGQALNWSEQLQVPEVRIAMGMVLVAVAANFFGLFNVTVPGSVAQLEGGATGNRREHVASLGMGFMMAVLSTPCSFGVLLAALVWGQAQPPLLGTLVFLLIGLGMAAPHALLCAFPKLVEKLPRPGRWMELFKQAMGFLLLPVALWLFSGLAPLRDDPYPAWVIGYGLVLAFCLWVWGTWVRFDAPWKRKLLIRGLAVLLAVGAGWYMLRPGEEPAIRWERFTPGRLDVARADARPVVVKFTAHMCLSCREVDHRVYEDEQVVETVERLGVVPLKADVTDLDAPGTPLLQEFKGAPPLTAVYLPDEPRPVLLPGVFDKQRLLDLLDPSETNADSASLSLVRRAPNP